MYVLVWYKATSRWKQPLSSNIYLICNTFLNQSMQIFKIQVEIVFIIWTRRGQRSCSIHKMPQFAYTRLLWPDSITQNIIYGNDHILFCYLISCSYLTSPLRYGLSNGLQGEKTANQTVTVRRSVPVPFPALWLLAHNMIDQSTILYFISRVLLVWKH